MNIYIIFLIIVISILFLVFIFTRTESFDIALEPSSAWSITGSVGYGDGYGTGYSMYGMWPADLPNEPWKWWMYGRMPRVMKTPYTVAPQIDYNDAPDPISFPTSNYKVDILGDNLAINGMAGATLQLDRNRTYFFQIYTPGIPFMFSADGVNLYPVGGLCEPLEQGLIELQFNNETPDKLYYTTPGGGVGGIIYLNNLVSY